MSIDIDKSIAALEKSLGASSLPSSSPSITSSGSSEKFFSSGSIKRLAICAVSVLLFIALIKPVKLCKLEYSEKEGKCKASLLLIKSFIAFLFGTAVLFCALTFMPSVF